MVRNIFIGDTVKTKDGNGIVIDARSWRESIVDMDDYQAREFSDKCRIESGTDFKERWIELLVNIKGKNRRILGQNVTVLEGRDV